MKKNNRTRLCFAALLVLLLCAALTPAVSAAAGDSPDNPLVLGKGKTVLTAEDAARLSGSETPALSDTPPPLPARPGGA